jgi:hypothetical protein
VQIISVSAFSSKAAKRTSQVAPIPHRNKVLEKLLKTILLKSMGRAISPSRDANTRFRTVPKLKVPQKLFAARSIEQICRKGFLLLVIQEQKITTGRNTASNG